MQSDRHGSVALTSSIKEDFYTAAASDNLASITIFIDTYRASDFFLSSCHIALGAAVARDRANVIKLLLDAGANPNTPLANSFSFLMLATFGKNYQAIDILLGLNDIELMTLNDEHETVLHVATKFNCDINILTKLLLHPKMSLALLGMRDDAGCTAHDYTKKRHETAATDLIEDTINRLTKANKSPKSSPTSSPKSSPKSSPNSSPKSSPKSVIRTNSVTSFVNLFKRSSSTDSASAAAESASPRPLGNGI